MAFKYYNGKDKESTTTTTTFSSSLLSPLLHSKLALYLSLFFSLWLLFLFLYFPSSHPSPASSAAIPSVVCPNDIGRFYVYDLPPKFNLDLLDRCHTLNIYTDMCPHVANRGLGRPIPPLLPSTGDESWYATQQFISEMIFHARAENHPCRTYDPTNAEIFYTPFYAGLYASSVFRQSNFLERDRLAEDFVEHLVNQPAWSRHGGADHFLTVGRTAWDFMRAEETSSSSDFGANKLFLLPAVLNMTVLTVERQPWSGRNQVGIPYPSYFHPRSYNEVVGCQEAARRSRRTHLFAFVGGPRKGLEKAAVREEILKQCGESTRCLRSKCEPGSSKCHEPGRVLEVMMASEFCMQPPGDSFTRRSVFDSVLAGCVPVFFSEHTAFTQYQWYLPESTREYSVFLTKEKWGRIEEELLRIPKLEVERMRERVIELIPSLTYAHPNSSGPGFLDVVDVALARLTRHVRERVSVERVELRK